MLNKKFQKKSRLVLLLTSFLILIVILSGSYLQTSGNQIPSYALPEILLVDLELEDSIIKYDIDKCLDPAKTGISANEIHNITIFSLLRGITQHPLTLFTL